MDVCKHDMSSYLSTWNAHKYLLFIPYWINMRNYQLWNSCTLCFYSFKYNNTKTTGLLHFHVIVCRKRKTPYNASKRNHISYETLIRNENEALAEFINAKPSNLNLEKHDDCKWLFQYFSCNHTSAFMECSFFSIIWWLCSTQCAQFENEKIILAFKFWFERGTNRFAGGICALVSLVS